MSARNMTLQRRRSIRPKINPGSQSLLLRSTVAQRRVSMRKSIRVDCSISTSLTDDEHKLLQAVSDAASVKEAEDRDDSSVKIKKLESSRSRLRKSLWAKRSVLTEYEATFLDTIVNSPEILPQDLDTCAQVLENDPLYNASAIDNSSSVKRSRRLASHGDKSYRAELWSHCATLDGKAFSCPKKSVTSSTKEAKQDSPCSKVESPKKEDKKSPFAYFWKRTFGSELNDSEIFLKDTLGTEESQEEEDDDDDSLTFHILGTSANDPDTQPHVLSPPCMDALRPHMPYCIQCDNFWLKYSMVRDGSSLEAILRNVRGSARTVVAVETTDGHVFGSFTSSPWRACPTYYGSGESFLWRMRRSRLEPCGSIEEQVLLESDLEIFGWSGRNRNVQFVSRDMSVLRLGGGGAVDEVTGMERETEHGFGLVLNLEEQTGYSESCETFGDPSPSLYGGGSSFDLANVEVWTMTPVDSVDVAERLELGRQFIFDHGNFVQE